MSVLSFLFKNFQVSMCAELEIIIWNQEVQGGRQIKNLLKMNALQPMQMRNCPNTPQGQIRYPSTLPFLQNRHFYLLQMTFFSVKKILPY